MKGFGGFPGGGNMQGLLKQAQKMQEQMKKTQDEMDKLIADGNAGGGAVKTVANGKGELLSIELSKEAVDPNDIEVLQEMILVAVNSALSTAREKAKAELEKVTGGFSIPGLF